MVLVPGGTVDLQFVGPNCSCCMGVGPPAAVCQQDCHIGLIHTLAAFESDGRVSLMVQV
jgi:hypothetical protein